MCKVIAIANQKGGVGKTTTTVNLGIGLSKKNKKVLFIDCDPQGSLTISLGYQEPDSLDITLKNVMEKVINDDNIEDNYAIIHYDENIDLVPANIELATCELTLINVYSRELILKTYIDKIRDNYDYIILDCLPSLGLLTTNALSCADSVLIPVQAAYLPIKGLQQLIKTIYIIKQKLNNKLQIGGIVLTMVDNRTNYTKDVINALYEAYQDNLSIFNAQIPFSVRASETSFLGVSIFEHDPRGKVAKAYNELVEEVYRWQE